MLETDESTNPFVPESSDASTRLDSMENEDLDVVDAVAKKRRARRSGAYRTTGWICIVVGILLSLALLALILATVSSLAMSASILTHNPFLAHLGDLLANPSPLVQCYFTCRDPDKFGMSDADARETCGCCNYLDICLFQNEERECLDQAFYCDLTGDAGNQSMTAYCTARGYDLE